MPHLAHNYMRHLGQVVPDGHCVALVCECSDLPETAKWRRGDPVRGSDHAQGTCVATFDPDGTYGNHTDGQSHAAILRAINTDGLVVVDQWQGQPVQMREIGYRGGAPPACDDADSYSVIEVDG